jgi:hypothetical protein
MPQPVYFFQDYFQTGAVQAQKTAEFTVASAGRLKDKQRLIAGQSLKFIEWESKKLMAVHHVTEPEITGCALKTVLLVPLKNIYVSACNTIGFPVYAVFRSAAEDDYHLNIIM